MKRKLLIVCLVCLLGACSQTSLDTSSDLVTANNQITVKTKTEITVLIKDLQNDYFNFGGGPAWYFNSLELLKFDKDFTDDLNELHNGLIETITLIEEKSSSGKAPILDIEGFKKRLEILMQTEITDTSEMIEQKAAIKVLEDIYNKTNFLIKHKDVKPTELERLIKEDQK